MTRKVLLTSLSDMGHSLSPRYFSVRGEFGYYYCDALLDAEASIKAALACFSIDEIIILGSTGSYDEGDELSTIPLSHGRSLYSADKSTLSSYGLLQYRIAQFADELSLDWKAEDGLPPETRERLIAFIKEFRESDAELKDRKPNRLFDVLSQNAQLYDRFWDAFFERFPELRDDAASCEQWVKGYLYAELKPSAKLELLPVNEGARIRLIPSDHAVDNEQWVDRMMSMQKSIVEEQRDIDLYVSLSSDDVADTFVLMNMLDILVSMPDSGVNLKRLFTVRSERSQLTAAISDDSSGFGVTELVHASRAFLNYGKADMIVNIWERSGIRSESISSLVYAMRHVDVGLSMCNIPEVEAGILRLRQLFADKKVWLDFGSHGMLFSVIVEGIRQDYGSLLEGDGAIPFIDLVKWAYRHQFYQQTLTLIESKAPENLVNTGLFYYCDDEKKAPQITKLFAEQRLELKSYEYYKMDNIEHYFIKTYGRGRVRGGDRDSDPQRAYAAMRTKSVDNSDPSLITGITACSSRETLMNLLFAYYHIGDVRNKINHAETTKLGDSRLVVSESDESAALIRTKDSVDFFIESYEKAVAELQGKKPRVVLISSDDVRRAAENMKQNPRRES
ncbi:MAG: hypothetical protein IKF99_21415 [Oscillospiraceae bacterium]|nr:hypothetical protein [Oscillospiraceae bacterium]